ncbi:uncharacterized protein LOC131367586 isoform X3 [Hemibagrus wyckioides]|uniref:uncharacterized protein LOC131367586 isoform X3 n=1 Tax=Hemibagrus wyckioides TaxID=337641 RepID=UPI00266BA12A|nr:uncharacterized protein LOC131367586 isoform X3 [Hemibagrus wyckioides]
MCVKYFVQLLMIFAALVPSESNCLQSCRNVTLNIQLGSQVLLPCNLSKSKETNEARWSQTSSLLNIGPNGSVNFDDPRDGRIIVFPYLFDRGNFSILVHHFQASDMGMYCCQLSRECQRVEIKPFQEGGLNFPWYYIAAGGGIFILLVIIFSLIYKFRAGKCLIRSSDSYYINSGNKEQRKAEQNRTVDGEEVKVDECDGEYEDIQSDTHEADYENAAGEEHEGQYEDTVSEEQDEDYVNIEGRNCQQQYDDIDTLHPPECYLKRDMPGLHSSESVYENDEHGPKQKSKSPAKAAAASRKISNQQPDSEGQYYANQSEIQKSARAGKRKKDKAEYQFKNPLYDQTPKHNK